MVYQKLFIDVFGDPEVNGDGTLNYSEKKDEKAKAKLKEIGKSVKKSTRKEKGKLGNLIKAIHNSNPVKDKYVVAVVEFYDGGSKHFTITPFNKEKIIEHLRELSKGKEMHEEGGRWKPILVRGQDQYKNFTNS